MPTTQERMRAEYSAAKLWWAAIVIAQILLLVLSALAPSVMSIRTSMAIGIAVFLIPVLTFLCKRKADSHYDRGEALRRSHLLEDSLGIRSSSVDRLFAAADTTSIPTVDPKVVGTYFGSIERKGLVRLLECIEESAFYTRSIARTTSTIYGVIALVGAVASIVILWLSVQVPATQFHSGVAAAVKVFPQLFGFFAVGVFAELWGSYRTLELASEQVVRECEDQLKSPVEVADAFRTITNYDCALAKTPPLPGTVKYFQNDRLASAWDEVKRNRRS